MDNSKDALMEWAKNALLEAVEKGTVSEGKARGLMRVALDEIWRGGLRGDVSRIWMEDFEYTIADIPDMYP